MILLHDSQRFIDENDEKEHFSYRCDRDNYTQTYEGNREPCDYKDKSNEDDADQKRHIYLKPILDSSLKPLVVRTECQTLRVSLSDCSRLYLSRQRVQITLSLEIS